MSPVRARLSFAALLAFGLASALPGAADTSAAGSLEGRTAATPALPLTADPAMAGDPLYQALIADGFSDSEMALCAGVFANDTDLSYHAIEAGMKAGRPPAEIRAALASYEAAGRRWGVLMNLVRFDDAGELQNDVVIAERHPRPVAWTPACASVVDAAWPADSPEVIEAVHDMKLRVDDIVADDILPYERDWAIATGQAAK
jgi:hypothetical protein